MTFEEILDQAEAMLQRRGRMTYRTLKRQFGLDDEALADLKDELIKAVQVARDENGEVLVWIGQGINGETRSGEATKSVQSLESQTLPSPDLRHGPPDLRPISYTPPHLVERIRAVTLTDG